MEITLGHMGIVFTTLISIYLVLFMQTSIIGVSILISASIGMFMLENMLSDEDKLILFSDEEYKK